MSSEEDVAKVCPSCKRRDITSFSKCRYCGTKYDAKVIEKRGPSIDERFMIAVCIAALLIGIFIWGNASIKEAKAKRLAPIITQIRAAHRPRVIEFYADWCGPCRSYGPVVESCRAKYAGQVDFQRLNVDDPNSRSTAQAFGVSGIPMTCMFDSQGNEVAEVVGGLSPEALDEYMHKLLEGK
jgi:thioredoxin 1